MEGLGYRFVPELRSFQPLDDGGSSTMTTIQVSHPQLVPGGVFEYQHAIGKTVQECFFGLRNGEIGADCRINGHDFEPGKEAIRDSVATWPQRGVQFLKQFAIIPTRT